MSIHLIRMLAMEEQHRWASLWAQSSKSKTDGMKNLAALAAHSPEASSQSQPSPTAISQSLPSPIAIMQSLPSSTAILQSQPSSCNPSHLQLLSHNPCHLQLPSHNPYHLQLPSRIASHFQLPSWVHNSKQPTPNSTVRYQHPLFKILLLGQTRHWHIFWIQHLPWTCITGAETTACLCRQHHLISLKWIFLVFNYQTRNLPLEWTTITHWT